VISFIIPAHNEEALIGRTLSAVKESASSLIEGFEVIVVNDTSTDRTGEIALEHGARLVVVNHRQIAATRNAGARAAAGEILIFVDADTIVTEQALRGAVRALRAGAVGGGSCVRFDGPVPFYAAVLERMIFPVIFPMFGLAPGCFLFCTRPAYVTTGGFDEELYCKEEIAFSQRLRRQGRFVILREFVFTSARKLRARTAVELFLVGLRIAWGGQRAVRRREGLEYWYGPREQQR
jgi:glycosyltransferase involved in cell wall biosynthesis